MHSCLPLVTVTMNTMVLVCKTGNLPTLVQTFGYETLPKPSCVRNSLVEGSYIYVAWSMSWSIGSMILVLAVAKGDLMHSHKNLEESPREHAYKHVPSNCGLGKQPN